MVKKYKVLVSKQAQKDFKKIKAAGLDKKLRQLYNILCENPFREYPP